MRYVGFEVAEGCDLVTHGGGLIGAKKKQKLSHRGSVLARKVWVSWVLGGGYPNGVRYIGFEAAGGCDLVMHRGGLVGARRKSKNRAIEGQFWLENTD